MASNKCHQCEYYDRINQLDMGICKRYPPILYVTSTEIYITNNFTVDGRRPIMDKTEKACGEFKEKA